MSKALPIIAIVDDEESIRNALQRLMRSAGLAVKTFPSGAEFLLSLENQRPDCVVLDLHMPQVNGFEVQARLAQTGGQIPIVIITGHDSDENRERAMTAGASAYLRKPVDDQMLLDAIAAAIEHVEVKSS